MSDVKAKAVARLLATLDLYEDGVALQRQNLRRRHPDESDEQIEERLRRWIRKEPDPA